MPKAVVRPSGDKVGLGTSWHDPPLLLLMSSQESEQVGTSRGCHRARQLGVQRVVAFPHASPRQGLPFPYRQCQALGFPSTYLQRVLSFSLL